MTDPAAIVCALDGVARVFVEDGCEPVIRSIGLALRLRTDTAFHLPVAAMFTKSLQNRLGLPQATADSIELALHEAVANAIIHGNLGISSQGRGSTDTYGDFCRMLEASLQDQVAAARMIHVSAHWTRTLLSLSVTDEGKGFTGSLPSLSDQTAHGRGLGIVRDLAVSVRWNQRRRRLAFVFKLPHGTEQ